MDKELQEKIKTIENIIGMRIHVANFDKTVACLQIYSPTDFLLRSFTLFNYKYEGWQLNGDSFEHTLSEYLG